jgi:hypothetical protein
VAAFGYLVFLLRVAPPHRTKEMHRLSAAGDNDDDLLGLVEDKLRALGSAYQREDKSSEGYRIKEVTRRNRTLDIRINKGPEGSPGETYDVETEESQETTEKQAQLSGLRALIAIPKDSYYGLLFVERIGVRHLKEVLSGVAIIAAARDVGVVPRIESFAELADWEGELAGKQAWRVSELLEVTSSADDASTPKDSIVHVSAQGGVVARQSAKIKSVLVNRIKQREERLDLLSRASDLARVRKADASAFTVQDEAELKALTKSIADGDKVTDEELSAVLTDLVPVSRDGLKHRRFDVAIGASGPERTFVVESNAVPQFVYLLGGRLTDAGLRDAWVAHAEKIFKNRGVTVPKNWATPSSK